MLPEISAFGLNLPTYGLISFIGLIVTGFVALQLIRKRGINRQDFLSTALFAGLGLLLGAHLLYAVTRIGDIAEAVSRYSDFDSFGEFVKYVLELCSGMVFYGGLYGGLFFGYLWARHKGYRVSRISDVFAVIIPLFHTFGRIGCFFAGCCYGVEWERGVSGRVITQGVTESTKRLPVQLIEAALLILLFAVMMQLFLRSIAKGKLIFIYLCVYAVLRFVLEFFRGDEIRGRVLSLSTSQWISIATILWVCSYLLIDKIKNRKSNI